MPHKLRKIGVMPVPMDFLPLKTIDISQHYHNMFWQNGQDILAAATLIRQNPRWQAIYLTSFGCGPDSFLLSCFRIHHFHDKEPPFLASVGNKPRGA